MRTDMELWKRLRPRTLDGLVGQSAAVKTMRGWGKNVPHAVLFTGPAGTGKTSAARVLAAQVGCDPTNRDHRADYYELNCGAVEKPLVTIQEIASQLSGAPMAAAARVWVLDETQAFSRAKFAQEAMLKMLEDGPEKNPHAYLFLCSTDPTKILKAVRSRCTPVEMKPVADVEMKKWLTGVAAAEKIAVGGNVVDRIVERAAGSCRTALVILENVGGVPAAEQFAAVGGAAETAAAELFKQLMPFRGAPSWPAVAKVLADLKDQGEDPEGLRQMLMAVAVGALLKDGSGRERAPLADKVIHYLDTPYLDRNTGWALLAQGCYRAVFGKTAG